MKTNPVAIITGASVGIGYDLAQILASHGYHLGLIARRQERLDQLKDTLQKQYPLLKIIVYACDVTDIPCLRKTIEQLALQLGRLDLLIANAGVGLQTPAWQKNWDKVYEILNTNIFGAIASLEAAKEIMLDQKSGHLVGITSVAGFRGLPTSSAYSTSKVALTAYLESIRIDLKPYGIRVTSIHPGFIATAMTAKNKYKMPFLLSSPQAANMIYQAIQRHKSRYIFPWQMKCLIQIMRLMPDWLYEWVMSFASLSKSSLLTRR